MKSSEMSYLTAFQIEHSQKEDITRVQMSFSSLLPPPKHSKIESKEPLSKTNDIIVKALTDNDDDQGDMVQERSVLDSMVASKLSFQDFVPIRQRNFDMELPNPSTSEIEETYERTKKVFDNILAKSLKSESTVAKSSAQVNDEAYELKYETLQASGAVRSRSLKIVQHAQDPLQPSQVKAGKVVAPPVEEPLAPILHKTDSAGAASKVTREEREKWNIPAAISSWKNPKGYTISLEKRLEMDARFSKENAGSQKVNEGFAKLSDALDVADREARREMRIRAENKRRLADEEMQEKEQKLRLLAQKAREERERQKWNSASSRKRLIEHEDDPAGKRELVRKAKNLELEKDIRKSKMSTADRLRELAYSQGRDISEKVILGAAKATDSAEGRYDSRLFSKGANTNARRNEDQLYDRPLFEQQARDSFNRANLEQIESLIQKDKKVSTGPIEFTSADGKAVEDEKEFGLQKK